MLPRQVLSAMERQDSRGDPNQRWRALLLPGLSCRPQNRNGARHCCRAPLRRAWVCRCSVRCSQIRPEGQFRSTISILACPLRRRVGFIRLLGHPSVPPFRRLRVPCGSHRLRSGSAFVCHLADFGSEDPPLPWRSRRRSRTRFFRPPLILPKEQRLRPSDPVRHPAFQHEPWQASIPVGGHRLSVRGPSWDHPLSRCPGLSLRTCPACGGETIISSGASCRLRFGTPFRLSADDILGRPSPWFEISLRRLASGDRKTGPFPRLPPLRASSRRGPLPPDHIHNMTPTSESRQAQSAASCLWITGIAGAIVTPPYPRLAVAVPFSCHYLPMSAPSSRPSARTLLPCRPQRTAA